MSAFVKDLKALYRGIQFKLPNLNILPIRGLIVSGICDLCAKALFLNIQQNNASYGCPEYTIETKRVDHIHPVDIDSY